MDEQTIEVIDNNGNVVKVKPLNLVINEEEAIFEFVTPLAVDPVGVWKVAGIDFDCDVAAQIAKINIADTELKLYNALTAAGIKNLEVANSKAYFEAEKPEDGFKTLAEVQAFVDEVNAEQATGEEQADKVEALAKALKGDSDVVLLNALAPWARVNEDFLNKVDTNDGYKEALNAMNTNQGPKKENADEFKAVQTEIDKINVARTTALVTAAEGSAKRADYNKAVAAMKFVKEDDAEKKQTTKADLQKKLDTLNLVLNVKEASTAAQFANAYDALVAHVDNKATIGTETFYTGLRKEYMEATKVLEDVEEVKDAAGIEAAIGKVNTVKRAELYNDVAGIVAEEGDNQTSTADVLKKLQALAAYVDAKQFDIETVETTEARLEAYRTELAKLTAIEKVDEATADAVKTAVENVQTAINTANAAKVTEPLEVVVALTAESSNEDILEALKDDELALGNVVDANIATYKADLTAITTAASLGTDEAPIKPADAIKALKEVIGDLNQVANINNASSADAVHTALLALSGNEAYINVPSADRLWVAEKVLAARNKVEDTKKFENLQAVRSALGTAATAHTNALKAVNDLTIESPLAGDDSVIAALSLVDADFAELSAAEQAEIAEPFFLGLKFAEEDPGKVSPAFRTLAAVKDAAGL